MPPDAARRRRFIAIAILLPVAVAAAAETGLRIAGYGGRSATVPLRFMNHEREYADAGSGPLMPDPVLFWRPRPGGDAPDGGTPIAASGFRTGFDVTKAAGVRRVACVGDSNTFGLGLRAEQTWPALLERDLRAAHPGERWEVLNLGVPGWTSWQVRRLLETEVAPMTPDVVIVETGGFNDWVPAVGAADREQGLRTSWEKLRLVELIASVVAPGAPPHDDENSRAALRNLATADYAGERRVPLADFDDDLRAIAAWCAAHDARVVFVVHPLPAVTVERNPICLRYADTVRRAASDANASLADGWAAFRASGLTDRELFRDFCHPTARGYELIASAVARALLTR